MNIISLRGENRGGVFFQEINAFTDVGGIPLIVVCGPHEIFADWSSKGYLVEISGDPRLTLSRRYFIRSSPTRRIPADIPVLSVEALSEITNSKSLQSWDNNESNARVMSISPVVNGHPDADKRFNASS